MFLTAILANYFECQNITDNIASKALYINLRGGIHSDKEDFAIIYLG